MRTATKPEKLGSLIKKLDTQVSLYVRLNAADDNGTVKCISCDARLWYLDADCAHFKDRDNMGTRFLLLNLAPACPHCNRFDHFNHISKWQNKLTCGQLETLDRAAKSMTKYHRWELEEMLEVYTEAVKQLRKTKNL